MSNMIKVDNLWFRYSHDSDWALQGIDLEIKKDQFFWPISILNFSLVGPNLRLDPNLSEFYY